MLVSQQNAWIHLLASIIVIAAGFYFDLDRTDWCLIILTVVVVWTAEAVNTALEFLADASTPDYDPLVGKAKDVAAGAVLILALGSLVIAVVVFWPHIQEKWFP